MPGMIRGYVTGRITKVCDETFGVMVKCYLDCGDGFTGLFKVKTYQIVHFIYLQFIMSFIYQIKLFKLIYYLQPHTS